jgi:hypothetical protein
VFTQEISLAKMPATMADNLLTLAFFIDVTTIRNNPICGYITKLANASTTIIWLRLRLRRKFLWQKCQQQWQLTS